MSPSTIICLIPKMVFSKNIYNVSDSDVAGSLIYNPSGFMRKQPTSKTIDNITQNTFFHFNTFFLLIIRKTFELFMYLM